MANGAQAQGIGEMVGPEGILRHAVELTRAVVERTRETAALAADAVGA